MSCERNIVKRLFEARDFCRFEYNGSEYTFSPFTNTCTKDGDVINKEDYSSAYSEYIMKGDNKPSVAVDRNKELWNSKDLGKSTTSKKLRNLLSEEDGKVVCYSLLYNNSTYGSRNGLCPKGNYDNAVLYLDKEEAVKDKQRRNKPGWQVRKVTVSRKYGINIAD